MIGDFQGIPRLGSFYFNKRINQVCKCIETGFHRVSFLYEDGVKTFADPTHWYKDKRHLNAVEVAKIKINGFHTIENR